MITHKHITVLKHIPRKSAFSRNTTIPSVCQIHKRRSTTSFLNAITEDSCIRGRTSDKTIARSSRSDGAETKRREQSIKNFSYAFSSGPNPFVEDFKEVLYREAEAWPSDLPLRPHEPNDDSLFDFIVAGAGPAGTALAAEVSSQGFSVCVVDPDPLGHWPNNYGVWVDEFQALGLEDCLHAIWPKARVFLEDSDALGVAVERAFGRVDRPRLKRKLLERCMENAVVFARGTAAGCSHHDKWTSVSLTDGRQIRGRLVADATGHCRGLARYDGETVDANGNRIFGPPYQPPAHQAAYGIMAEVRMKDAWPLSTGVGGGGAAARGFPYDPAEMLFMDWRQSFGGKSSSSAASGSLRTTCASSSSSSPAVSSSEPSFLYAMPLTPSLVFLEETSLSARPPMDIGVLKERLKLRLDELGLEVTRVLEEEYCLIPMGGSLPRRPQRVIAFGGAAGYVHPASGFMVSRALLEAGHVGAEVGRQLRRLQAADQAPTDPKAASPAAAAVDVWCRAVWPAARLRQRAFLTMGLDLLLPMDAPQTQDFFRSFFALPAPLWRGFLSARLSFLQMLYMGLRLFMLLSSASRLRLVTVGLPRLPELLADLAKAWQ